MTETKHKKRRGITLVLGGGGARGLAHIGVIEVLEEHRIPIERVVGTSAGALIGGMFCAGKLKETKEFFLKMKKWDIFKSLFSLPSASHLFNSKIIDAKLCEYTKGIKIEDLKKHFVAVAFDIVNGRRVIFDRGELFDAIRSSISIPGIFKPFQKGESLLVDGGVTDNLPVDVAKKYSKKHKIVAVNVGSSPGEKIKSFNFINVLNYASYFQTRELSRLQERQADIVIRPNVKVGTFDFQHAKEIINIGRMAAKRAIPAIKLALEEEKLKEELHVTETKVIS
ncbi:MAG: patatin-like phospholipase family protein [Candidatus Pacearchaeota archaeon]|jgi:NTE family protein